MKRSKYSYYFLAIISAALPSSDTFAQGMGNGGWHVSQKIDPMTDAKITRGAREYRAGKFFVQVIVFCKGQDLTYNFWTFNAADHSPASMNLTKLGLAALGAAGNPELVYAPGVRFRYRRDNAPATTINTPQAKYSNLVTVRGEESDVQAKRILVEIDLAAGTTLVTIDQTDPRLRFVFKQCFKL